MLECDGWMWSFDRHDEEELGRSGTVEGLREAADVVVVDTLSTLTRGVVHFFDSS